MKILVHYILFSAIALLWAGTLNAQALGGEQRTAAAKAELSVQSNNGSRATATERPPVTFTSPELQVRQHESNKSNKKNNKKVVFTSPELQVKSINRK